MDISPTTLYRSSPEAKSSIFLGPALETYVNKQRSLSLPKHHKNNMCVNSYQSLLGQLICLSTG